MVTKGYQEVPQTHLTPCVVRVLLEIISEETGERTLLECLLRTRGGITFKNELAALAKIKEIQYQYTEDPHRTILRTQIMEIDKIKEERLFYLRKHGFL